MCIVGLDSGFTRKHSIASFMMSISWFWACSMGGGMRRSNKSFNKIFSSTDEADRMELISPGWLLLITSIAKTPKLNTSHFSVCYYIEITIIILYEIIVIFYNLGKLGKLWLSFFYLFAGFIWCYWPRCWGFTLVMSK